MTSSAARVKGTVGPDCEVHVSFEDQQKINKFARLYACVGEYREELKTKQLGFQSLEDASEELMLLDGNDSPVLPILSGETFVHYNLETAQKNLDELKKAIEKNMKDIESKIEDTTSTMNDLKTYLYAKFGENINLEPSD